MDISEMRTAQMSRALAYALGLSFPFYKSKKVNGVNYVLGCVNHNPGMITDEDLAKHFKSVKELFDTDLHTKTILIKDNRVNKIQSKLGFSILINQRNYTDDECIDIMTDKVRGIEIGPEEYKIEFAKGCFDGRSSWDKTAHFLSIDVDRNYDRQNLMVRIIESLGININVNNRDINHPKNDQVRIKPDSLHYFMRKVGLYSTFRERQVENGFMGL